MCGGIRPRRGIRVPLATASSLRRDRRACSRRDHLGGRMATRAWGYGNKAVRCIPSARRAWQGRAGVTTLVHTRRICGSRRFPVRCQDLDDGLTGLMRRRGDTFRDRRHGPSGNRNAIIAAVTLLLCAPTPSPSVTTAHVLMDAAPAPRRRGPLGAAVSAGWATRWVGLQAGGCILGRRRLCQLGQPEAGTWCGLAFFETDSLLISGNARLFPEGVPGWQECVPTHAAGLPHPGAACISCRKRHNPTNVLSGSQLA